MGAIYNWKREVSWWDDLEVPDDKLKGNDTFDWLQEVRPHAMEHDYVLSTDGSGCKHGWGGYAAIIQKVGPTENLGRAVVDTNALVHATYGSTVQRCELTSFIDGVHSILHKELGEDREEEFNAESHAGPLSIFSGPNRLSILWLTDRANLAKALLFNEYGEPLNARKTEIDLWLRYSGMARYVCVTPQFTPRNTIQEQAQCDELAGTARKLLKEKLENLEEFTTLFNKECPIPQKARF